MLNALSCLCLLEGFRMRSLKAITKKSWLITLSIRAWSHRPLCAVSAETKGWCWILSICLVPDQWSSITEWVKAEKKKKKKVIQPNLCCLSAESCRGQRGECPAWAAWDERQSQHWMWGVRVLIVPTELVHTLPYLRKMQNKWDQRWEANICQYLARSVFKVTFLLFQEIVACTGLQQHSSQEPCSSSALFPHCHKALSWFLMDWSERPKQIEMSSEKIISLTCWYFHTHCAFIFCICLGSRLSRNICWNSECSLKL